MLSLQALIITNIIICGMSHTWLLQPIYHMVVLHIGEVLRQRVIRGI
jgi:hypothetical protein